LASDAVDLSHRDAMRQANGAVELGRREMAESGSTASHAAGALADPAHVFERHRPRLRALAYRMLGTLGDAVRFQPSLASRVPPRRWLSIAR
jgi:hypothetical protein